MSLGKKLERDSMSTINFSYDMYGFLTKICFLELQ